MILLRLISWQYARKHLLRSVLTGAGIVLGVAVFVGMHTANQSVVYAFQQTVDRIAGSTQLEISAGETGFDESVLERVQAIPSVRAAAPAIEAVVNTGIAGQGSLLILGVDMTGDRNLREYDLASGDAAVMDDSLTFLAQPDSLMVTATFAQRNGLRIGSQLGMSTMEGQKLFTVRGILRSGGLTSAFGGNLAVMDIYAAQKVFGRGRRFDRIDVLVQDGTPVEDCQAELKKLLGPGFQVEQPAARAQQFESMSRIYSMTANITSLFALFIGMFIIYNTFAIAVTQRRGEIGILRSLGATRRQIRALFLGESAVAGLAGSVAGVLFGIVIARSMAGYLGGLMGEVYGVAARAEEVSADPKLLAFALVIGIATSIVAAIIPARSAARVDPVKALQKGKYQVLSEGENRARRFAAFVTALLSALCLLWSRYALLLYPGYMLAVVAALLLTPTVALWLARLLRPALRAILPVEGTLAADSLIQTPRRTSSAVAALMLSLALVVAIGGLARASYMSIRTWLDVTLNPDLFVTSSESVTSRSFRFPSSMGAEIAAIEGVDQVQSVRTARVVIGQTPIMLVAPEISKVVSKVRVPVLAGDTKQMFRITSEGKGVLASDNFALLHGYKVGDMLDIPTPSGMLRLPIVGVVTDYSDQQGSILMDRRLFQHWWKDDSVDVFRVYVKAGAPALQVKEAILKRFSTQTRLFVLTNGEVRKFVLRLTDQLFGITYLQIAVAVLVAMLGIVNTLTVSITDRRRELGVLQAVGALRRQIRRTIWMEALSIGVIGSVLGFALGAVNLYYALAVGERSLAGLRLSYEYPVQLALILLPAILVVAFVSALGPAEAAVRGSLVEALEYE